MSLGNVMSKISVHNVEIYMLGEIRITFWGEAADGEYLTTILKKEVTVAGCELRQDSNFKPKPGAPNQRTLMYMIARGIKADSLAVEWVRGLLEQDAEVELL
jgi:hypothetical protein